MEKEAVLKSFFDKEGFVAIRNFLSAGEISALKSRLEEFIRETAPSLPPEDAFYEDKNDPGTLKQMFHLSNHSPYFRDLLLGSKFAETARFLLGENTGEAQMEYFNKPPGISKPTPPHQDSYYFMINPPNAITFWLPLEDVDEENGCLRYVKGSHLKGMRPHGRTSVLGFSQGISDYGTEDDQKNEIAVPAKVGDVLAHHGMTIHRADGNSSQTRSRKVLGFVYFAASAKEDLEAKEIYRQKLKEETKHEMKI